MASLLELAASTAQPFLGSGGRVNSGVWQPWAPSPAYGVGAVAPSYGLASSALDQLTNTTRGARSAGEAGWAAQDQAWRAGNAGWSGQGNTGPFTAQTLEKNPELAAILRRIYGDIAGISTDPNKNQTVVQRNTKAPEVERAAQASLQQQQADANNNAASIADFTKAWLAAQPAAKATAEQEAGAIGSLYDGSYEKKLADQRNRTALLTTQNLARRLSQISNRGDLNDLARGGVTNSFDDANLLKEGAAASLARDLELAGLERSDIMSVMDKQLGAAGQRQRILDAVLQRPLMSIQAGQTVAANDLNRLQGVSSLLMANNVFTPQTQSDLVRQVLGLLGGAAGVDPAAYYRYVRGDFPNSYPGLAPQQNLRLPNIDFGGGGGGASLDDFYQPTPTLAQPMLSRPTLSTPGSSFPSYDAAVSADPTVAGQRNSAQARFAELVRSFSDMGYDPNAVANWLGHLSLEQLNRVPLGGYE